MSKPKTTSISKLITIFLCFFTCFLGIYVWINQQALMETEQQIAQSEQEIQNLKTNGVKTTEPPIPSLSNNQSLPNLPHPQPPETFFQPADSQKFIGFDKLIGFKEELKVAQGFIDYLKKPENYQGIGEVESPFGILMYGCPGTGKTTFARAIAKETNLPFFEINSSFFSQKYKGVAPQMVKDLFTIARLVAEECNGVIIFLDECETIFTDLKLLEAGSEIANVVNQFKIEMTSLENNPQKPIFIMGVTNQYHLIDEAIKSRFTYNIEIKPGNKAERQQMLEFLIKKRKNPYGEEAKQYLYEVINEALEHLPDHQQFLKANRTLENLLKTTVSIFAQTHGAGETPRNEIDKSDLKQAYQIVISPDLSLLDQIENQLISKGGEK
ncbi:AAA family ATPase [Candidatus Phytoplasma bonamiae]|uniref:ATP-binding protein n=1 Tax=Candidatus Phytoplasma bonamiae TaxID=2982626 RepID=A0ABT9D4V7_9MOLU|nr:ATP-binding protein ['Bonamia sp.' little leaf phytoplasma]MDO8064258.1 ATP-binding protein ['Bonamia sp.' little leaf phytoplasma]